MTIANSLAVSFPDKLLSIDTIEIVAFPPVDNSGQVFALPRPFPLDALTSQIVANAIRAFPGRLSVQWDALSNAPQKLDPHVQNAKAQGAVIGWQTNCALGARVGTAYFRGGPITGLKNIQQERGPCRTPREYQEILDRGINLGGSFLEVFWPNVEKFPTAVQEAQAKLAARTTSRF